MGPMEEDALSDLDESSDLNIDEEANIPSTSAPKRLAKVTVCIAGFAKDRELGKCRNQFSISRRMNDVRFCEWKKGKVRKASPISLFEDSCGGFLGMSPDGSKLIGLCIREDMKGTDAYVFDLDAMKSVLRSFIRIGCRSTTPYIRVFFPENLNFCVLLSTALDNNIAKGTTSSLGYPNDKSAKRDGDHQISCEYSVDVVCYRQQIQFGFYMPAIKFDRGNGDSKLPLRIHNQGFLFNNDGTLVSVLISSDARNSVNYSKDFVSHRSWCLTKDLSRWDSEVQSNLAEVQYKKKIALEMGETLIVRNTSPRYPRQRIHMEEIVNSTSKPKITKESIVLTRFTMNVDAVVTYLIERNLNKKAHFANSKLLGCDDHEVDIIDVINDRTGSPVAKLMICVVCEVQVRPVRGADPQKKENELVTRNEFHVFRVDLDWKLSSGYVSTASINHLKQVSLTIAKQSHKWYPYKKFPVAPSDQLKYIDNMAMFTGKNQPILKSQCPGMVLLTESSEF